MTIGVNNLINSINQSSERTDLSPLEITQLSGSNCVFETPNISTVACCDLLPSASCNKGRLIYDETQKRYLMSDGTEWVTDLRSCKTELLAWGVNNRGQLGDNTTIDRSSPVSVVGGFTDWCQVSAGACHSLAMRQDGTIWSWGFNGQGRLGDNTVTSRSSPVSVVGGFTDWCQVSAGGDHSLAVRQDGTIWSWGSNGQGMLGDNTVTSRRSPVSVVGGFTDWCQVSTGLSHSLAVRQNGTIWSWGTNGKGQLGDNTVISRSSPVSVVGGFTDWCQVSAGGDNSLAVRQDGTIWSWGFNNSGQLGDDTTAAKLSPVSVVGGFADWCQVSAGGCHSLAVRQDGTVWSWGYNGQGRLGDNTITNRSSPVSVVGGFTDWYQVSAGRLHSLAVRQDGTIWSWGSNFSGLLGDNTTIDRSSPVSVVGGFTDWCQISAGVSHSLGLRITTGF